LRENIRKVARLLREAARELEEMEKLSQWHEEMEKMKYVAVFFAPNGEPIVNDRFSGNTIEEVLEAVSNRGSLWFFYPFVGVVEPRVPGKVSLRETNVVYFDLEPIGEKDYDIMVGELSEVLDLPMPISEVSKEMEKIYNRIWGEEEEFEFKKSSSRTSRNKSDSYGKKYRR
jgi:hypothetical protein